MGLSSDNNNGKLGDTDMIELTGKIMIVTLILLFFILFFAFFLHLYARHFRQHHREQTTAATTRRRRRRRFDFSGGHQEIILLPCSHVGLDPKVLKSIPVVVYDPNEFEDGLECAVCLCEVSEGEKARILVHCSHGFHVECIDMWFQSHSTCPLCRNPVANEKQPNLLECSVAESSTRSDGGVLMIDILRTKDEEVEENLAMKRFLSGDAKAHTSTPTNLDLENGGGFS